MKLGLYGGTFDPIHHGHLILAREALERLGLDRLIFIPAARSPFKDAETSAPARDRLRMVELAIADEPRFGVDAVELERPPPSYTVDTVEGYRRRHPQAALFWLLGEDHVAGLPRWHRIAQLRAQASLVVLAREAPSTATDLTIIHRRVDISATEIRIRVAQRLPITYLVPERVLRYLQDVNLYRGDGNRG